MKMRQSSPPAHDFPQSPAFPGEAALAALRGWYAGLPSRAAVDRYLPHDKAPGESARGILSQIRQQFIAFAGH